MKPNPFDPLAWIDDELAALDVRALRRRLTTREGPQSVLTRADGRELINFGSNDYLGLAADERLVSAAIEAIQREGCGAGASPLVSGRGTSQRMLEEHLANFEGAEAALVFPSGFAANSGTIAALVGRGDAIFADQHNHASIIDGCRLSRAEVHIYPHRDCDALENVLRADLGYRRRLIVTDSLFSMHGDLAPLVHLAEIAERHHAMLLIDEAHATGVFGSLGRGLAEACQIDTQAVIRIGTLSKALASAGGFVTGSRALIDWLANRARPYMFSTALPAAVCAAASAAISIVREQPQRRIDLLARAESLRTRLRGQQWQLGDSASQIIPLLVGSAERAVEMSAQLREWGFWVPGIRPPSVPEGQSLLRIGLSYAHTPEMIDALVEALGQCKDRAGERC